MPKNRKRKGPQNRGPQLPSMKFIQTLAKHLDSPEMREIYRTQKRLNPNLDKEVDELTKEIEEILNHDKDSS